MRAKIHESIQDFAVPIDSVTTYPGNPRRGDVETIKGSLTRLGQYRLIVGDAKTHHVLAGNHTRLAAKELGWDEIAVHFVEVTPEQAERIVLADNRLGDLGEMDLSALNDLLAMDGGDIDFTGYTSQEVERIASQMENADLFSEPERESVGNAPDLETEPASIQVGPYRFEVEEFEFTEWVNDLATEAAAEEFTEEKQIIRQRLGLVGAEPTVFRKAGKKKVERAPRPDEDSELSVPVQSLKGYPHNANQGDISGIAASLKVNGQYRPIVVSQRTLHVLVGNNTWLAAMALGWKNIDVTFLDVTPEEERLIVLTDNKSAQRSSYDMSRLSNMLEHFADNPEGTGFSVGDISEILGKADEEAAANARVWVAIKHRPSEINWRIPCSVTGFTDWLNEMREKTGASDEMVELEVRRRLKMSTV